MKLAIDCDLRRIHAVASDGHVVCKDAPSLSAVLRWIYEHRAATVLFEIAGAVDYTDSKAIAHNKRRWTIWNVAQAATLNDYCERVGVPMLVSPSSKWTLGHEAKVRHAIASCMCPTHDLREAEAMLWFHTREPNKWQTLSAYLEAI